MLEPDTTSFSMLTNSCAPCRFTISTHHCKTGDWACADNNGQINYCICSHINLGGICTCFSQQTSLYHTHILC